MVDDGEGWWWRARGRDIERQTECRRVGELESSRPRAAVESPPGQCRQNVITPLSLSLFYISFSSFRSFTISL